MRYAKKYVSINQSLSTDAETCACFSRASLVRVQIQATTDMIDDDDDDDVHRLAGQQALLQALLTYQSTSPRLHDRPTQRWASSLVG